MNLLHRHGRIVGFSHMKTFTYPHKPAVKYSCPHISRWLYWRAEVLAWCFYGPNCEERSKRDHERWRERNGFPPLDDYDEIDGIVGNTEEISDE